MKTVLPAALVAILSTSALATDSVIAKLDPAWAEVEKKTVKLLGQQGQRQLVDMAYAEIATDACPRLELNQKAMSEGFDRLSAGKKTPAEDPSYERNLMTYFGVYTGLILSESFIDKESFCQQVEGVKQRKGGPTQFWTAK